MYPEGKFNILMREKKIVNTSKGFESTILFSRNLDLNININNLFSFHVFLSFAFSKIKFILNKDIPCSRYQKYFSYRFFCLFYLIKILGAVAISTVLLGWRKDADWLEVKMNVKIYITLKDVDCFYFEKLFKWVTLIGLSDHDLKAH